MTVLFSHRRPWYVFFLVSFSPYRSVDSTSLLNEAILRKEENNLEDEVPLKYGVDVSFPMHHIPSSFSASSCKYTEENRVCKTTPLTKFAQDRLDYYHYNFLKGCKAAFGEDCLRSEKERIEMAHRQPQTMKNMTSGLGFRKLRLPPEVFESILEFWQTNRHEAYDEPWPAGGTYINHWETPPGVVRVDNTSLPGGGYDLTSQVWEALRPIVSEWTGQHLEEASMYGIRIYKTGNILATHVDRQPLVSSVIINVDQDLDEPWPLEVIGHDGLAHNITMEPGDLVLYESHSILHGRPYPLKGRFLANMFVHFEPTRPDAPKNSPPIYRLPMKRSDKKCTPTLKQGRVMCIFE
ncbi:Ankyrin Repeat [Seminavis robusta]|uniref:Ankyrin Repeat n=1 Tax=Seminavis robusta TaxID=568900 RepID=A0A9N8HFG0_9STRA|nr:Ankyrin Repeat [Seminavis robusta]|eukprot:Sro453_g146210.1 Ankyrin Repeat (351) ;mRNA; r:52210-53816